VGGRLVADPRVRAVSFTGGLETGLAVARACAARLTPAQLELGGNNALLVLEGADLDAAAAGIVTGLTTLNGQWCRAVGRIFVHRAHHDGLMARVLARLANVRLGSSLASGSEMGPLANGAHFARVHAAIDTLGARGGVIHRSTPVPALTGNFLAPTLITGIAPGAALDEIFGPVATVHPMADDAEALAGANASPFGLAAYVFGEEARAIAVARRLDAGSIKINGVSLLSLHPDAPRPAWGLSGVGDEGTRETLRFFCGTRVIGVAPRERT
jgi:acyl-CoA reductase-like NAD-dependent aldehyde dehydrogenase